MRRLAGCCAAILISLFLASPPTAQAQGTVPVLRISTENSEHHIQTRAVTRFIGQLKKRAGDAIVVEFYPEAQLYRDRDVIRALEQGRVEMALPGSWQFDRFVPDVGLYFLPLFYGLDDLRLDKLRDSKVGADISQRIERTLDVKVLGRWIDLGPAHLFTLDKRVARADDMAGLMIRTPGGEASALRLRTQNAKPILVPWPDLPQALRYKHLDGLVTTFETAASAQLWQYGIRHAYEDRAYFAQYVPLVSAPFWKRLSPTLRQVIIDSWEATVGPSRVAASQAQSQARSLLAAHGVAIVTPSPEETAKARSALLEHQAEFIKNLGMDPELARRAEQFLAATP